MRIRILQFALALSLLSAVSCPSSQKPMTKTALTASPSSTSLVGTEWLLTDLTGTPVIANSKASLAFMDGGRAAGNGSCNRFTAAFSISGDTIKLGPFASTRMACMDGDASAQEDHYLKILGTVKRYEIKNDTLLIYGEGSDKPLQFSRQASSKP